MKSIMTPTLCIIGVYLILAMRIWSETVSVNPSRLDGIQSVVKLDGPDSRPGAQCTNFDDRFDELVASTKSVFILMPAKAAGTSLKKFTFACAGIYSNEDSKTKKKKSTNFINDGNDPVKPFMSTVNHPKILTSHVYNDHAVVNVLENTPRDNLNVYIYREETDRLLSAIREVVVMSVCTNNVYADINADRSEDRCVIDERVIVEKILQPKKAEVGFGNAAIMTCDFYEAIENVFPRMVFVHYKQANNMQRILSKHYCPDLEDEYFHNNMASDKRKTTLVRLDNDGTEMDFDEWLGAKRHTMELTFKLRSGNKCQGKTRKLEDKILACEDGIVEVTGNLPFI